MIPPSPEVERWALRCAIARDAALIKRVFDALSAPPPIEPHKDEM